MSKRCAKATSLLSVFMPFEHVKKYVADTFNLEISETCLQDTVYSIGNTIHKEEEKKGRRPETVERPKETAEVLYVQADGSMVPIRGGKTREFKEAKLGLVYTNRDIVKKKTKKGGENIDIMNKRFVGSIGDGVDPFKRMLFAGAIEKGYYSAKEVVLLTDGAVWISKMKDEYFPKAIHILDWYHAVDHLWQSSHALFGQQNTERCEQWVLPLKEKLWNGMVDEVITYLENEGLSGKKNQTVYFQLRGYFQSNRENMRYDVFRAKGYYIGSGAIESAHKYIIASRMKQAGMRWCVKNANAMIWLRCVYFEDRWDSFWDSMNVMDYMKSGKMKQCLAA